jgi:tetratricopeptide (TPR) repeat protein
MVDQLEYIDDFFHGKLTEEDAKLFENRIESDPSFAADVAFYVSAMQSAKSLVEDKKRKRYKELYHANGFSHRAKKTPVRHMWYGAAAAMAAAIVTAILVGVFYFDSPSPREMATNYVNKNFHDLPQKMGVEDEMQKGLSLYNSGDYKDALVQFENVMVKDKSSSSAREYAGLAALKLAEYDKALDYFRELESNAALFSNPAAFLQAVTLMERNQPGDKQAAKLLLQQVVAKNLEGKETAQQWLKNF